MKTAYRPERMAEKAKGIPHAIGSAAGLRDHPDEVIAFMLVGGLYLSAVATVVLLLLAAVWLAFTGRLKETLIRVPGSTGLAVFCLLSLVVSVINRNVQGILIAWVMGLLFLVTMRLRTAMTRSLFDRITGFCVLCSLPGFVAVVIQKAAAGAGEYYRPESLFLNANYYGAVASLTVLLCAYKAFRSSRPLRAAYAAAGVINLCGLLLSGCRTALPALAAAMIVLALADRRYRFAAFLIGSLAVALAVIVRHPELLPREERVGADLAYRLSIWETAVRGILRHPLVGRGGNAYLIASAELGRPSEYHAHSLILDPLLNFGLAGTMLLASFYLENWRAIRILRSDPQDRTRYALLASVMVCVLLHGLTDVTVFSVQTGTLVSVLLGVAGICERTPASGTEPQPAAERIPLGAVVRIADRRTDSRGA